MKDYIIVVFLLILTSISFGQTWISFPNGSSKIGDLSEKELMKADSVVNQMLADSLDIQFLGAANHLPWKKFHHHVSDALDDAKRLGRARIIKARYGFGSIGITDEDTAGVKIVGISRKASEFTMQFQKEAESVFIQPSKIDWDVSIGALFLSGNTEFSLPEIRFSLLKQTKRYSVAGGVDFNGKGIFELSLEQLPLKVSGFRAWEYLYRTDYWTTRLTALSVQYCLHNGKPKTLLGIYCGKKDSLSNSSVESGVHFSISIGE